EQRAVRAVGTRCYGVVALDELLAGRRQRGAAARLAAHPLLDDGLAKRGVQVVDEQPRAPIRHLHLACGGGDRLVLADLAQQLDLARADLADAGQREPNPELDRARALGGRTRHLRAIPKATNDLAGFAALHELEQRASGWNIAQQHRFLLDGP